MSRFDRRLKPDEFNKRQNNMRSSSPRPGQATCKLRPVNKNNGMLGKTMFMGDIKNPNRPNIEVIESSAKPISNKFNDNINNVSNKNNKLKQKLKTIQDPNVRIIYNHEIRLNNMDLALESLSDIKCKEVLEEQKEKESLHVVKDLRERVTKNNNMITPLYENIEGLKKSVVDINKNISDLIEKRFIKMENEINDMKSNSNDMENEKDIEKYMELKRDNDELKFKFKEVKELMKKMLIAGEDEKDNIIREIENL